MKESRGRGQRPPVRAGRSPGTLEPEGQLSGCLGCSPQLLAFSSQIFVTGVNQNPQASLQCAWDSSSSNERSCRAQVGVRGILLPLPMQCQTTCWTELRSALLSVPRVTAIYRQTKPPALGPIFLSVCMNTLAGPPGRTASRPASAQTSFLGLSLSATVTQPLMAV